MTVAVTGAAFTARLAVLVTVPTEAEMITAWPEITDTVITVNVALICPPETVANMGVCAAELFDETST
jgi:hypothetical protein